MPQGPRPDHAPTVDRLQRKKLLAEFDRAWRNGTPPLIEGALPADAKDLVTSDSAWRDLLEELVKIDLGYRWRAPAEAARCSGWRAERPRLDDYVVRYTALGPLDSLSSGLIVEEYWVRHRWGIVPTTTNTLPGSLGRSCATSCAGLMPSWPRS